MQTQYITKPSFSFTEALLATNYLIDAGYFENLDFCIERMVKKSTMIKCWYVTFNKSEVALLFSLSSGVMVIEYNPEMIMAPI